MGIDRFVALHGRRARHPPGDRVPEGLERGRSADGCADPDAGSGPQGARNPVDRHLRNQAQAPDRRWRSHTSRARPARLRVDREARTDGNRRPRPGRSPVADVLPRIEDIPARGDGLDSEHVREAFDAFRRHAAQLQAQLRVLQAAGRSASVEATGHAVRMDALHLIRAAAEFADTIERDAQNASAAQLGKDRGGSAPPPGRPAGRARPTSSATARRASASAPRC